MNWKSIGVLAAILTLVAGCASKADAPADVAAIKAMVAAYGQAATTGDVIALSDQYTDDAVRLEPNAPMLVGKEAIHSGWRTFLERYNTKEVDVAEDVHVVGDLAFARGTYTAKETPKVPGAAVVDDKGKWLTAYRRQPGGSWKIVVDIWNTDMPVVQVLSPGSADEQALLQIERDWTAAWLKQDAVVMAGILAEGYVENANGQTTPKKQYVADMKAGIYEVESAEASDMRVVVFGDHAVVNGSSTSKYTMRGKDASRKTRWTDTFEKRDGRWRAVVSYIVKIE
jgi:ketosteroid isomerase-like protein